MGWTFQNATRYKKNGEVDRKAEVDDLYAFEDENVKVSVLKSRMVGSTYYGAIKVEENGETTVHGSVVLTSSDKPSFNFGYKAMSETSGPFSYDCPKSILDLLSPTTNENALEWRRACREKLAKPKLCDLPVGSVVEYELNGRTFRLTKMAPAYQFKRTWWYRAETGTYVPSRRIPEGWKLVDRV